MARSRTQTERGLRYAPKAKIRPGRKIIKTLVIDRSRWLQGRWSDITESMLRSNSGNLPHPMMCCLGFFAKRLGLTNEEITDIGRLDEVSDLIPEPYRTEALEWRHKYKGSTVWQLMSINDDPDISSRERERRITRLFKEWGVAVRFTGKYLHVPSL